MSCNYLVIAKYFQHYISPHRFQYYTSVNNNFHVSTQKSTNTFESVLVKLPVDMTMYPPMIYTVTSHRVRVALPV